MKFTIWERATGLTELSGLNKLFSTIQKSVKFHREIRNIQWNKVLPWDHISPVLPFQWTSFVTQYNLKNGNLTDWIFNNWWFRCWLNKHCKVQKKRWIPLKYCKKLIYLSNTFISSNPIFIHHNYFQRIIFQFFHGNVKFKLLVKLGIQCILFDRSFLFFCPLTTIMEPNFCIRILKLYSRSVSASVLNKI